MCVCTLESPAKTALNQSRPYAVVSVVLDPKSYVVV